MFCDNTMTEPEIQLSYLRDARLADHALDSVPMWLWAADAGRLLWANPNGAEIFGAAPGAAPALRFDARHAAAAQIARLVGTLPHGTAPRLERLRGFGA